MLLDNTPNTTGWPSITTAMGFLRPILRNNVVYRWMAQYLPVSLHKTGDIPAEAKGADAASPSPMGPPYIFCYHPQGDIFRQSGGSPEIPKNESHEAKEMSRFCRILNRHWRLNRRRQGSCYIAQKRSLLE
jgi:hypothetical protein